jgi:hypothetical protein
MLGIVRSMSLSVIFHWLAAIVFGLIGWWLIILNFSVVYYWFFRRKHHSWIPLAGGFIALLGMAFCPLPQIRRFAFLPLIIDTGFCILALAVGFLMELYARRKRHDA